MKITIQTDSTEMKTLKEELIQLFDIINRLETKANFPDGDVKETTDSIN